MRKMPLCGTKKIFTYGYFIHKLLVCFFDSSQQNIITAYNSK
jgi:hypothetical protein